MKNQTEIAAYNAVYEHNVIASLTSPNNSSTHRFHKAMQRSMHIASLEPEFSGRKSLTENKKLYYAVCVGLAGGYLADSVTYFRYDEPEAVMDFVQSEIDYSLDNFEDLQVLDTRRGSIEGVIYADDIAIDVQLLEGDMPENED